MADPQNQSYEKNFNDGKNLYVQAQFFVNFLTSQQSTDESFIDKIMKTDNMKFYMLEKNRQLYPPLISTNQGDRVELTKLLYSVPYSKLNM